MPFSPTEQDTLDKAARLCLETLKQAIVVESEAHGGPRPLKLAAVKSALSARDTLHALIALGAADPQPTEAVPSPSVRGAYELDPDDPIPLDYQILFQWLEGARSMATSAHARGEFFGMPRTELADALAKWCAHLQREIENFGKTHPPTVH